MGVRSNDHQRVGGKQYFEHEIQTNTDAYVDGVLYNKDVAFAAGWDPTGLTTQTQWEDADVEGGNTLAINSIYDWDWDSATAGNVLLPAATKGAYIVVRMVEAADGTADLVITTNGDDVYAEDSILSIGTGLAAAADVSAGTGDNILTLSTHGSNNGWGEIGSSITFYCREAGSWQVKLWSVPKGSGAGTTLAFS